MIIVVNIKNKQLKSAAIVVFTNELNVWRISSPNITYKGRIYFAFFTFSSDGPG